MNITIETRINYNFNNFYHSPEDQLRIIKKYEKQIEDVSFSGIMEVLYTTSSSGEEWFKVMLYIGGREIEVAYIDKKLYITEYSKFKEVLDREERPFYTTNTYKLLNFICNDGSDIKYTLPQAIELFKVIHSIANNEDMK